jgi:hypothetical protein
MQNFLLWDMSLQKMKKINVKNMSCHRRDLNTGTDTVTSLKDALLDHSSTMAFGSRNIRGW